MKRFRTYRAYSIGCAIAWAIVWIAVGTQSSDATREHLLFVFLGWLLGWTSASIARLVYPQPHRRSE